eukprot:TRINITY_DN418_c3_g1_i1.p1 TRINITY_DN418_c3_g1~~TRINITY_DN418_c3_g1_i1.p1  ORF type:complete len:3036 (+),score=806.30 TRINITY_DN418_c3_g1_i1:162-9269(+)
MAQPPSMARSTPRFTSVNLNSSYGKPSSSGKGGVPSSSRPAAGGIRGAGGMVLLGKTSNSLGLGGTSSLGGPSSLPLSKPGGSRLLAPRPVNLPSRKREHGGNDPRILLVGAGGAAGGAAAAGWTRPEQVESEPMGAAAPALEAVRPGFSGAPPSNVGNLVQGPNSVSTWGKGLGDGQAGSQEVAPSGASSSLSAGARPGVYTPPSARGAFRRPESMPPLAGPGRQRLPLSTSVILRGEDFPSLMQATQAPPAKVQQPRTQKKENVESLGKRLETIASDSSSKVPLPSESLQPETDSSLTLSRAEIDLKGSANGLPQSATMASASAEDDKIEAPSATDRTQDGSPSPQLEEEKPLLPSSQLPAQGVSSSSQQQPSTKPSQLASAQSSARPANSSSSYDGAPSGNSVRPSFVRGGPRAISRWATDDDPGGSWRQPLRPASPTAPSPPAPPRPVPPPPPPPSRERFNWTDDERATPAAVSAAAAAASTQSQQSAPSSLKGFAPTPAPRFEYNAPKTSAWGAGSRQEDRNGVRQFANFGWKNNSAPNGGPSTAPMRSNVMSDSQPAPAAQGAPRWDAGPSHSASASSESGSWRSRPQREHVEDAGDRGNAGHQGSLGSHGSESMGRVPMGGGRQPSDKMSRNMDSFGEMFGGLFPSGGFAASFQPPQRHRRRGGLGIEPPPPSLPDLTPEAKLARRRKEELAEATTRDLEREKFEEELERVQKQKALERQRKLEEELKARELVRLQKEEEERLAKEEEMKRLQAEDEAREAAEKAAREEAEAAARVEEERRALREEKQRLADEEERRKEGARQKLRELEERIARREAQSRGPVVAAAGDDEDNSIFGGPFSGPMGRGRFQVEEADVSPALSWTDQPRKWENRQPVGRKDDEEIQQGREGRMPAPRPAEAVRGGRSSSSGPTSAMPFRQEEASWGSSALPPRGGGGGGAFSVGEPGTDDPILFPRRSSFSAPLAGSRAAGGNAWRSQEVSEALPFPGRGPAARWGPPLAEAEGVSKVGDPRPSWETLPKERVERPNYRLASEEGSSSDSKGSEQLPVGEKLASADAVDVQQSLELPEPASSEPVERSANIESKRGEEDQETAGTSGVQVEKGDLSADAAWDGPESVPSLHPSFAAEEASLAVSDGHARSESDDSDEELEGGELAKSVSSSLEGLDSSALGMAPEVGALEGSIVNSVAAVADILAVQEGRQEVPDRIKKAVNGPLEVGEKAGYPSSVASGIAESVGEVAVPLVKGVWERRQQELAAASSVAAPAKKEELSAGSGPGTEHVRLAKDEGLVAGLGQERETTSPWSRSRVEERFGMVAGTKGGAEVAEGQPEGNFAPHSRKEEGDDGRGLLGKAPWLLPPGTFGPGRVGAKNMDPFGLRPHGVARTGPGSGPSVGQIGNNPWDARFLPGPMEEASHYHRPSQAQHQPHFSRGPASGLDGAGDPVAALQIGTMQMPLRFGQLGGSSFSESGSLAALGGTDAGGPGQLNHGPGEEVTAFAGIHGGTSLRPSHVQQQQRHPFRAPVGGEREASVGPQGNAPPFSRLHPEFAENGRVLPSGSLGLQPEQRNGIGGTSSTSPWATGAPLAISGNQPASGLANPWGLNPSSSSTAPPPSASLSFTGSTPSLPPGLPAIGASGVQGDENLTAAHTEKLGGAEAQGGQRGGGYQQSNSHLPSKGVSNGMRKQEEEGRLPNGAAGGVHGGDSCASAASDSAPLGGGGRSGQGRRGASRGEWVHEKETNQEALRDAGGGRGSGSWGGGRGPSRPAGPWQQQQRQPQYSSDGKESLFAPQGLGNGIRGSGNFGPVQQSAPPQSKRSSRSPDRRRSSQEAMGARGAAQLQRDARKGSSQGPHGKDAGRGTQGMGNLGGHEAALLGRGGEEVLANGNVAGEGTNADIVGEEEGDFIQVRSKKQMLNDRREQQRVKSAAGKGGNARGEQPKVREEVRRGASSGSAAGTALEFPSVGGKSAPLNPVKAGAPGDNRRSDVGVEAANGLQTAAAAAAAATAIPASGQADGEEGKGGQVPGAPGPVEPKVAQAVALNSSWPVRESQAASGETATTSSTSLSPPLPPPSHAFEPSSLSLSATPASAPSLPEPPLLFQPAPSPPPQIPSAALSAFSSPFSSLPHGPSPANPAGASSDEAAFFLAEPLPSAWVDSRPTHLQHQEQQQQQQTNHSVSSFGNQHSGAHTLFPSSHSQQAASLASSSGTAPLLSRTISPSPGGGGLSQLDALLAGGHIQFGTAVTASLAFPTTSAPLGGASPGLLPHFPPGASGMMGNFGGLSDPIRGSQLHDDRQQQLLDGSGAGGLQASREGQGDMESVRSFMSPSSSSLDGLLASGANGEQLQEQQEESQEHEFGNSRVPEQDQQEDEFLEVEAEDPEAEAAASAVAAAAIGGDEAVGAAASSQGGAREALLRLPTEAEAFPASASVSGATGPADADVAAHAGNFYSHLPGPSFLRPSSAGSASGAEGVDGNPMLGGRLHSGGGPGLLPFGRGVSQYHQQGGPSGFGVPFGHSQQQQQQQQFRPLGRGLPLPPVASLPTYVVTGKEPDWKHVPVVSAGGSSASGASGAALGLHGGGLILGSGSAGPDNGDHTGNDEGPPLISSQARMEPLDGSANRGPAPPSYQGLGGVPAQQQQQQPPPQHLGLVGPWPMPPPPHMQRPVQHPQQAHMAGAPPGSALPPGFAYSMRPHPQALAFAPMAPPGGGRAISHAPPPAHHMPPLVPPQHLQMPYHFRPQYHHVQEMPPQNNDASGGMGNNGGNIGDGSGGFLGPEGGYRDAASQFPDELGLGDTASPPPLPPPSLPLPAAGHPNMMYYSHEGMYQGGPMDQQQPVPGVPHRNGGDGYLGMGGSNRRQPPQQQGQQQGPPHHQRPRRPAAQQQQQQRNAPRGGPNNSRPLSGFTDGGHNVNVGGGGGGNRGAHPPARPPPPPEGLGLAPAPSAPAARQQQKQAASSSQWGGGGGAQQRGWGNGGGSGGGGRGLQGRGPQGAVPPPNFGPRVRHEYVAKGAVGAGSNNRRGAQQQQGGSSGMPSMDGQQA